jgi:hypothetical protein
MRLSEAKKITHFCREAQVVPGPKSGTSPEDNPSWAFTALTSGSQEGRLRQR